MKNEKLLRSIGSVEDKYIEEAIPKCKPVKRKLSRLMPVAACIATFIFGTAAFAANYIQNSITHFYLRYLTPEDMAIADMGAEQYGVEIYFDALKSDDLHKQYFAVNKLAEYYNDEEVRPEAIRAITPFVTGAPYDKELADLNAGALSDAASFTLSILTKTFDDPRIIKMADGSIIFTLFNDYSDYGTFNRIWIIENDELRELVRFKEPKMYIAKMIPSPDKTKIAVELVSNKSSFIEIWDLENGRVSPELVTSACIKLAHNLNLDYLIRTDNENYCDVWSIKWADNDILEFNAELWNDKSSIGAELFVDDVVVRYDFRQNKIEYYDGLHPAGGNNVGGN